MLLQRLKYNVTKLLNSDVPVAIGSGNGERLKRLVRLVQKARHGVLVVETGGDADFVFAIARRREQDKLVSDTRKWKNLGYQLVLKRRDEHLLTPQPKVFVLPDGQENEILGADTVASVFTHRILSGQKPLPPGYRRL